MGKMETLNPCKIETLEQIDTQFVRIDYVQERNVCSKFGNVGLMGFTVICCELNNGKGIPRVPLEMTTGPY